jgi:hypothetical protein
MMLERFRVGSSMAMNLLRRQYIDIGEHSSGNDPWQNAIDAAEYELDKRKRASLIERGVDP